MAARPLTSWAVELAEQQKPSGKQAKIQKIIQTVTVSKK